MVFHNDNGVSSSRTHDSPKYAHNRTLQQMKQEKKKRLQGKLNKTTIIYGDFNIYISIIGK